MGEICPVMENISAFSFISHSDGYAEKKTSSVCLSNKHSLCLSHSISNGPRDKPEPGAHALCHRLRFLWQPKNQWHVLRMLQGTPDTAAEQ